MFDYTSTQSDITMALTELGFNVTLVKATGGNVKTFGIWGKSESKATDSLVIGEQKTMYMVGSVKKTPEVGDSILIKSDTWFIANVESYKPTSVAVAYKLTVTQ